MFLIDTPDLPAAPVTTELTASAETAVSAPAAKEKVLGVCMPLSSWLPASVGSYVGSESYVVAPRGAGLGYLEDYEGRPMAEADFKRATFTWLKKPALAELVPDPLPGREGRFYLVPHKDNNGGRDRAEALFELDGTKVRIVYFLHWDGDDYVMDKEQAARLKHPRPGAEWEEIYCTETGFERMKKLSHTLSPPAVGTFSELP